MHSAESHSADLRHLGGTPYDAAHFTIHSCSLPLTVLSCTVLHRTVLQLKALGIDNVMKFEWLSPPPAEAMVRALEGLAALGVLDGDARWVVRGRGFKSWRMRKFWTVILWCAAHASGLLHPATSGLLHGCYPWFTPSATCWPASLLVQVFNPQLGLWVLCAG